MCDKPLVTHERNPSTFELNKKKPEVTYENNFSGTKDDNVSTHHNLWMKTKSKGAKKAGVTMRA